MPSPHRDVYVGLGANLPVRLEHLRHAVRRLSESGRVIGLSPVYESEPIGSIEQPLYLNMVVRMEAALSPRALLRHFHRIEAERGRERSVRNAARTLDLDLLLYGQCRVAHPGLTVPHPRMTERAFVLVPLLDLGPELVEPQTGRRYSEYLSDLRAAAGEGELADLGLRWVMSGEELLDVER